MNAFAKPVLERSTCFFWTLSPEEQERWNATTSEGRKAIEKEYRTKSGLDNMIGREQGPATAEQVAEAWAQARYWTEQLAAGAAETAPWARFLAERAGAEQDKAGAEQDKAGPVPYYECDDDDMRWLE
jgi:uncharacterized phage-associated protein